MHVMYRRGLTDKLWKIVYELNKDLTAEIETKYGPTMKIDIADSIRQGGVLAVDMYGILMDQTNQEQKTEPIGIKIQDTDIRIPSLLWVDDDILLANSLEELQRELDIVDDVAARYHIEFGAAKSNVLKIGREEAIIMVPIGNTPLAQTTNYKYLGFFINTSNNLSDQLTYIKGKVEAAYQTILHITGDVTFNNIEMKVIWQLVETIIIPIALHTAEIWNPTEQENKQHNKILEDIILRILMCPTTTPKEVIYIETSFINLQTQRYINRLNMTKRVMTKATETTKKVMEANIKGGWKEKTEEIKTMLRIHNSDKRHIKSQAIRYFKNLTLEEENKSKVRYLLNGRTNSWEPLQREKYLDLLTKLQASAIFKARTRMINVKDNFRGNQEDLTCRFCRNCDETQEHVLSQCGNIHYDESTKVYNVFNDDINQLRLHAKSIIIIENLIKNHNTTSMTINT